MDCSRDHHWFQLHSIGYYCFDGCTELFDIKIPRVVNYIYAYAFRGCTSLEQLELPPNLYTIYASCFYRCTSLISLVIPSGVSRVEEYAFAYCYNLTSITFSRSANFSRYAFYYCNSLRSLVIPAGSSVYQYAIASCENLFSLTLMDNVYVDMYGTSSLSNLRYLRLGSNLNLRNNALSTYFVLFVAYCGMNEITRIENPGYYDNRFYDEIRKLARSVQVPMSYVNDTFAGVAVNRSLIDGYCYQPLYYDDYEYYCDPPLECPKEYISGKLFWTFGSNIVYHVAST